MIYLEPQTPSFFRGSLVKQLFTTVDGQNPKQPPGMLVQPYK